MDGASLAPVTHMYVLADDVNADNGVIVGSTGTPGDSCIVGTLVIESVPSWLSALYMLLTSMSGMEMELVVGPELASVYSRLRNPFSVDWYTRVCR